MTMIECFRKWVPREARNALRRPGTSLRRLVAKLRRIVGAKSGVEPVPGWQLSCHPICVDAFMSFRHHPEQRLELLSFIGHCRAGMRFMDVGTHWGMFTLAALHFGGDDSTCLDIEASNAAVKVLKDNLTLNDAISKAIIVNAACGDEPGVLSMLTTGAGGADYFIVPQEQRADCIKVEQVTVDQMAAMHRFSPTHLKIDVEGYEREVLIGARRVLTSDRPIVFLELLGDVIRGRGGDPEAVLERLGESGHTHWQDVGGMLLTMEEIRRRRHNLRMIVLHENNAMNAESNRV
jgi:FkbM family methyltransferase